MNRINFEKYLQSGTLSKYDSVLKGDIFEKDDNGSINTLYYFNSEIKENGFQDFVEEYITTALGFELFLIKESPRVNGEVDFIGFDEESRIFLIEVKCHYDSRAKFNVIFQGIKYCVSKKK